MRNPLKRRPRDETKPTLRERAAALKTTAGCVMGGPKPDPKAVPDAPNARVFAVEQAALIDLSALSVMQLGVLFDRFDAASNAWSAELHLPYADERKCNFRINTAAGDVIEREQERLAEIRDRIAAEIGRRQPTGPQDADTQLETSIRSASRCGGAVASSNLSPFEIRIFGRRHSNLGRTDNLNVWTFSTFSYSGG